jgi:hypothetical protein
LEPIEGIVRELQSDYPGSPVAIFRSPSTLLAIPAPQLKPVALIEDRFDLRSLLGVAASQKSFWILALSQNRTRLLKCTEATSEEVPLEDTFVNLHESMQTKQPDHVLDNRAAAGPSAGSSGGVMFGTAADADNKDQYLTNFFLQIDRAVNAALRGQRDPLVVVGVEYELALYHRLNTYAHICEPGIHGSPDGLDGREMHRRVLDFLTERTAARGTEINGDFDKKVGTGHASTHVQEIVAAAFQGRVSHLYLQENATYMGSYDRVRQRVKHTNDPLDSPEDLVAAAAYQTIIHGGEARILPASALPGGVPVCALFRYPAASPPQAAETVESAA